MRPELNLLLQVCCLYGGVEAAARPRDGKILIAGGRNHR